ncbi:MAG: sigma-70 family RNA polymerase sigma factor [Bacteroidota bacterium]
MQSSQDQFVSLIQEHSGIIYKIINLYVDDQEERRDIHQEVLLQAWKSFTRFEGKSKFSTWLYRVVLNTVLTFRRKSSSAHNSRELMEGDISYKPASIKDESDALLFAVKSLPEVDRSIITLHLEGYANTEVSEILGISSNHVGVKIHRIKKVLEEKLKKLGYGS